MATNTQAIVAPFYSGDDEEIQAVTAGVAASALPTVLAHSASTAQSAEGEAIIGGIAIDASGSMLDVSQAVVEGFNFFRAEVMKSTERRKTQLMVLFFNSRVTEWNPYGGADPFMTLLQKHARVLPELSLSAYSAYGSTALYRAYLQLVATCDLMAKSIEDTQGVDTRQVIIGMTDGFDNVSRPDELAQLRSLITRRRVQENWTGMLFGIADPTLVEQVAAHMGVSLHGMSPEDRKKFEQSLFQAVGCGTADKKLAKAIASMGTDNIGMGLPSTMVDVFPSDGEEIRRLLGVKMSSTFIRASQGKISASIPIGQQMGPDPNAAASAGSGTFI
jgi:hypothetical protein